ncbi:MAG: AAA family ATPase, partial [Caldisericia bacterium]
MSRAIVITSGKGGVGKTTLTANIGYALSMDGSKIVLVDTDIGLRNLDVILGLENRIVWNILHVARRECELKSALVKDKRLSSSLYLLPAAQTFRKDDLGVEEMQAIVAALKTAFDYVLLDC